MKHDYSAILSAASELFAFQGYLDTEDLKAKAKAEGAYKAACRTFVYEALKGGEDWQQVIAIVSDEIDQMREAEPYFDSAYLEIREDLMGRLEKEGGKAPLLRKAIRWAPAAFFCAIAIAYFSVRIFSGIDVSAPLESKQGLIARAQAVSKASQYDELMSTSSRRGSFLKPLLFWPIEPTEEEMVAAGEFVWLVLDAGPFLEEQGIRCMYPSENGQSELSDEQVALVENIAENIQSETTEWLDPPTDTVLATIIQTQACQLPVEMDDSK